MGSAHRPENWRHPGAEYIFDDRYRDTRKNLRTRLTKIIRRAGLSPWPRLWHNLRVSRQTELVESYPAHVVSYWLGNSVLIASKHYLQVTDEHYQQAAAGAAQSGAVALQKPVQQDAATLCTVSQSSMEAHTLRGFMLPGTNLCETPRMSKS